MAKKAEVRVAVTVDGASQAAGEIGKVEKAAAGASAGGLSKLTKGIEGDLKNALSSTLPGATGNAATGLAGIAGPALGAGVAIAGLALKGVGDFEKLGVSIGNFSTVTGTTMDEASRWTEVSGDLGVGADTVEAAFGRMNKKLGASPDFLDQYGIAVGHAKDGTIDANATFLNAIDRLNGIKDPALQAATGAAIFGKGWQGMAALIGAGAPQLRADLASVQPEKIFTAGDANAAKGLRDGFDAIKDAGEGLMLTLGRALAPTIAALAPQIGALITKVEPLVAAIGKGLVGAFDALEPAISGAIALIGPLSSILGGLAGQIPNVIGALGGSKGGLDNQTQSTKDLIDQFVQLNDKYKGVGESGRKFTGDAHAVANALEDQKNVTGSNTTAMENMRAAVKAHGDEQSGRITGQFAGFSQTIKDQQKATEDANTAQGNLAAGQRLGGQAAQYLAQESQRAADVIRNDMAAAAKHAQGAIDDLTGAYDTLKGSVSDDQAYLNLEGTFNDVRDKAKAAFEGAQKGGNDARDSALAYKQSVDNLKQSIIDVGQSVAGISPETTKKLLMEVDKGQLDDVQAQIETIRRNNVISLQIVAKGGAGFGALIGARAEGGDVQAGGTYLVGERGPEVLTMGGNGHVTPNGASVGGGHTYVTINMPVGTTGEDVVSALKKYEKRNGPGWKS